MPAFEGSSSAARGRSGLPTARDVSRAPEAERLQVKVATTAGNRRDQAEGAIRQLRRGRHALAAGMAEVTSTSGEAWCAVREHVKAAGNELESQAAEVEGTLQKGNP